MRRTIVSLLFLLFAVHALVPAVTTYVCIGMTGKHSLHPCCKVETTQLQRRSPAISQAHCCAPQEPLVIDACHPSQDDSLRSVRAPLAVAAAFVSPAVAPVLPALLLFRRARGSPRWSVSGPPRLKRQVLRI